MRPQILTPALLLTSSATWSKSPDLLDLFPCLLNKEDDLGKLWSPFYLLKINCNGWNIQYKHYSNKCIMISLVMAPALGWTQGKVQRRVTTAILNSMNLITGCLSLWAVWACWLCRRTRKHSFSIKLCLFSGPCKHRHDPHNFIFQITERKSSGIFFFFNISYTTDKDQEQSFQWHFDIQTMCFSFRCLTCSNTWQWGTHTLRPSEKSEELYRRYCFDVRFWILLNKFRISKGWFSFTYFTKES